MASDRHGGSIVLVDDVGADSSHDAPSSRAIEPHPQPGRTLDEWERYRALVDASNEAYEQIAITWREARFAVVLLGAFGLTALLIGAGLQAQGTLTTIQRTWIAALLSGYIVAASLLFLQALDALRPGRFKPRLWDWSLGEHTRPAGVRYYEDVVRKSAAEHWQAWQAVRLAQLNAEISVQLHSLSMKSHANHRAIRRLYLGLRVLVLLLGGLMAGVAWLAST
ncbi:MAG TPA: hypothetical protein VIY56_01395 [Vicinamibacterales bacterium]